MQGVEANPNLYVHNVPKDSNEEELRHLFGQFGNVERVRLKVNQKVGPHAVYAFVTFSSTADAQRALSKLQGSDVRGRALRIEFQRTSLAPSGGGGGSSSSAPTHSGTHNVTGGTTYYSNSAWDDGGIPPTSSPSGSSPELRTPLSLSGTFSTQSTTHSTTSYHELFRRDSLNANSQHNAMWGTPSVAGAGGGGGAWNRPGPATTSENAPDNLMPPFKRGRFHSPSSRRPRSPIRSANVLGPDSSATAHSSEILNILGQLKELVSQSHPHALSLVDTLSDMLRPEVAPTQKPNVLHPVVGGASEKWPYSELSPAQQAMVRDGTLTLNQENNRYLIRLSPLLAPLKPAMFNRRGHVPMNAPAPGMVDTRAPNVISPESSSTNPNMRKSDHQAAIGGYVSSQPYVAPPVVQALSKPVESSQAIPPISHSTIQPSSIPPQQSIPSQPSQQQPPPQQQQHPSQQSSASQSQNASSDEATWIAQLNTLPITQASARKDVWQGTLARNEKKKMPVSVKRVAGYIEQYLPTSMSTLNISHRSALEEMWKKKIGAIGILEAESPEVSKAFQEYITYFKDKNRAGVARLDRSDYQMVYLLPPGLANLGDYITSNLPTSGEYLLAIVGRPPNAKVESETNKEEDASKSTEQLAGSAMAPEQGVSNGPSPPVAGESGVSNEELAAVGGGEGAQE